MKCKCGHEATVFVDDAGYGLPEPICNLCFIEADRQFQADVAEAQGGHDWQLTTDIAGFVK